MSDEIQDERLGLPSASSADRFYNCAVSHSLEATVPKKNEENALATEGTLIHEALEREDGSELTMDQFRIAEKITEIEKFLYAEWRADFPINSKGVVIREERFWLWDENGKNGSAKPDVVYIIGDHALCIDAKTGFKQVEDASRNKQGRLQAVAVYLNHPEVVHVRSAFAQFRLTKFYTQCDYSKQDLDYALQEWNFAVWRSKQPDAAANPGPWCAQCRARGFCKSAAAYALLPAVPLKSMPIPDRMGKKEKQQVLDMVSSLPLPALREIYDRRNVIGAIMDSVADRMNGLSSEELKALGYELHDGASYITHVSCNSLFQSMWDEGFWNHITDPEERTKVAMSQFEKVTTLTVGKAVTEFSLNIIEFMKKAETKGAAEAYFRDLLAPLSTTETKGKTLRKIKG